MDESDTLTDREALQIDEFPDDLSLGSTVILASDGDPAQYAICLRILCQYGNTGDSALIVTTTESADATIGTYERLCSEGEQPSLGLVDTTAEQPSVSALYGETPVVFIPSPGDLERLVLALSDLSRKASSSTGARHLVIRSLTPILEAASTTRVQTILERITGLRSETGFCLLGLDYTAHDEATMRAIAEQADGIVWVTHPTPNQLDLEYRPARECFVRSLMSDDTDV